MCDIVDNETKNDIEFDVQDSISIPLIANDLFEGSEPLDSDAMKALRR